VALKSISVVTILQDILFTCVILTKFDVNKEIKSAMVVLNGMQWFSTTDRSFLWQKHKTMEHNVSCSEPAKQTAHVVIIADQ
jgi:hypothetical protein